MEVDDLYIKRQGKGKKSCEEKIAAVHEGWQVNGKRAKLDIIIAGVKNLFEKDLKGFWWILMRIIQTNII
ncbi:hypothetical protein [Metasolibacillus meyeri]|uniref:hypothetical protein n=1 Tax=Metasolibacillus meyeri TaxID=1071052 RepID=UPI003B75BDE4